jgi:DNA modification methylase
VLKSDGLLIAYSGQFYMERILEDLGRHLRRLWILAQLHAGQPSYLRVPNMVQEWKPIVMFKKSRFRRGDGRGDVLRGAGQEKDRHPWQQAEDEAAELVKRFSNPGDLVVDPFVGSATTGAAALRLGRRFLGCDVDPAALEVAAKRLAAVGSVQGEVR